MSLFKKELFEYKILERCRINIKKTNEKYFSSLTGEEYEYYMERDYCEKVAENDEYCFYRYKSFGDGSGGYILRQEKNKPRKIVFFGESKFFNIVYNGFLFQVNHSDELRFFGITARNIKTGELHKYNWLSKKTIDIVLSGFGRLYCQDSVKDVFIDDGKLYFKISRKKSHEATMSLSNSSLDIYDDDLNYDLIVTYEKGHFIAKSVFYSFNPNEITDINNAIETIKGGGVAELSRGQIASILINLSDAKKKLTNSEFEKVYSLFQVYNSSKEKSTMDMYEYLKVASEVISAFNIIAPYEKYSGMNEYETKNLLEEIQNNEALIKANGLVYGIRGSIGDVFYKLDGSNAAVFSIISISSALKNYLDKKSTNNPIFEKISRSFVREIAKKCANNNEAINEMIKNISSLSQSFEERIAIAKNNFEGCNEIELYGIAAASLYCNFQESNIDIDDESKLEMYFEIFKTVFVKLVESL